MPSLNWIGKEAVVNHDKEVPFKLLKKVKEFSVGENSENLIIHGDNLEALKALMPYYAGKIKCIYIDPPYNTGNEGWIYNDKVNSPKIKQWLDKTVKLDDLTRHDKWLCMMYPRLKLLKDMLSDDGVIFISIDDNEVYNLRILLNDIFGIENFVAELPTVMNLKGNQDEFGFAGTHEYTLVWAKNKPSLKLGEFEIGEEDMDEWQEDEIGYFKKGANLKSTGINAPREKRPNLFFPLYITSENKVLLERKNESDSEILPITDGKEMSWRWGKEKITREPQNLIVIRDGKNISIYKKQRPSLGDIPSKKPKSIFYKPEYSSGNGTAQIKNIFGEKVFGNPKPVDLISDFIRIGTDENSIILDSFAGSGTTAHAVLGLNKIRGNRKFILVEMEDHIARDITAERIRRAIEKYGYNGGFEYCELDKPLFNAEGQIEETCEFNQLANYIYFTETQTNLDPSRINKNFIGDHNDTEYYLIYKEKGKNVLNKSFLNKVNKNDNRKVVYADRCLIDDDVLAAYSIQFKQIPYEVKVY